MRRLARILIGVLGLLLLVVGPPVLLWTFRSVLLPDHVPGLQEVVAWFTERDTGQVFLLVIAAAGMVAWLQLVVAALVESVALVRGVSAPRLPGFRWAQRLVAGILFALLAGTTAAEASQLAAVDTPAITAPQVAGLGSAQPAHEIERSEPPPTAAYTVVPGDSLMSIAAAQLGDEARYQEIFDLNKGRRQSDGGFLRSVDLIKPGWQLVLPEDPPDPHCVEVVVEAGDTLTQIAQEHLGAAERYHEIFALTKGRPQPGGRTLTDPDLIRPGDILQLPAPVRPSGGGGAPQSSVAFDQVAQPVCGPEPVADSTPAPPPHVPEPSPPPTGQAPIPVPGPADKPAPVDAPDEEGSVVPLVAVGLGGLLAAGILATLGTRRLLAQRRRQPGHRIRRPNTSGDLEIALRKVEEPATVELLDASLRTLAHHVRETGRDLPAIRSAVVGSSGITLHPQEPGDAPEPFVTMPGDDTVWHLDSSAELLADAALKEVPAPYPALVSLGHDLRRDLVMVNLEQLGAITLDGAADDVEAVLLAMAWELSASAWADHLIVTLIGFGHTTAAHNPDRLRHAETVDAVLDSFQRHTDWTPEILLSATPFTAEQEERLADLVTADGPATCLAAVVTAAASGGALPGAWNLDVSASPTPIEALDLDVDLQRLTPGQAEGLVAALAAADNAAQTPAEDYRNVPPEPDELPEPLEDADSVVCPEPAYEPEPVTVPEIRLLGPVGLHNVDPSKVEGKKINRLTELAAFLMLHPGAAADEISRQLGTDTQPWSASTRQGYISRLRTWLGRDQEGNLYLPNVEAHRGGYRLSDSMSCDWLRFQRLAHLGLNQDPANRSRHLEMALDLVTGMPFSNINHGRYAWSSWLQREMIDAIVDVAHTLADTCQQAGDLPAARRAILRGLVAEPVSEILYRDLLRVEYRAGNLAAVKDTADKLAELAAAMDVDLDDETNELVRKMLDVQGRPSAAAR